MTETQKAQPVEVRRRGQPVPRTYVTAMAALLVLAGAGRGTVVETSTGTPPTVTSKPDTAAPAELNTINARSSDSVNFARLHGWIAYDTKEGIWAVDPKRPNHHLQLSDQAGSPLSWPRHASKLLISRRTKPQTYQDDLFVLNADGSETRLTDLRRPSEHPHLVAEHGVLKLQLRHSSTSAQQPDKANEHEVGEGSQGAGIVPTSGNQCGH
jgi:hypothetical protein